MPLSSVDVGNPRELLGVGLNATEHDITAAFRKASLKVHPDRCPNDPHAAAKFRQLTEARDTLLDQSRSSRSLFGGAPARDIGVSWVVTSVPRSSSSSSTAPVRATPAATPPASAAAAASATTAPSFSFSVSAAGSLPKASASTPTVWSWTPPPALKVVESPSVSSTSAACAVYPNAEFTRARQQGKKGGKTSSTPLGSPRREARMKLRMKPRQERIRKMIGKRKENERICRRKPDPLAGESGRNISKQFLDELSKIDLEMEDQPLTKHARHADPLGGLRSTLEDVALQMPEMPMANRQMLAGVCEVACAEARSTPVDTRHEFLTSVLEMIEELLAGIVDTRRSNAETAIQEARAAAGDVEKFISLADDCAQRRTALEAQRKEISDQNDRLEALKDELAMAIQSEREASSKTVEADQAEKDCAGEKRLAESALLSFQAMEANGLPAKVADAKRMCKEIEVQMTVMNVHRTLFPRVVNAVIPALRLPADKRSRSDEGAMAAAEGCFTSYLQEKASELHALSTSAIARRDSARRAKADVERVRQAMQTCSHSVKTGKAQLKLLHSEVSEADQNRKQLHDQVASSVRNAKALAKTLKDTIQLQKNFETLLGAKID